MKNDLKKLLDQMAQDRKFDSTKLKHALGEEINKIVKGAAE